MDNATTWRIVPNGGNCEALAYGPMMAGSYFAMATDNSGGFLPEADDRLVVIYRMAASGDDFEEIETILPTMGLDETLKAVAAAVDALNGKETV